MNISNKSLHAFFVVGACINMFLAILLYLSPLPLLPTFSLAISVGLILIVIPLRGIMLRLRTAKYLVLKELWSRKPGWAAAYTATALWALPLLIVWDVLVNILCAVEKIDVPEYFVYSFDFTLQEVLSIVAAVDKEIVKYD